MPTLTTIAIDSSDVAVALAELAVVDEVQPDRARHDGEREDRVGEVVQRPRSGHDRPSARGQTGQTARRVADRRLAGSGPGARRRSSRGR